MIRFPVVIAASFVCLWSLTVAAQIPCPETCTVTPTTTAPQGGCCLTVAIQAQPPKNGTGSYLNEVCTTCQECEQSVTGKVSVGDCSGTVVWDAHTPSGTSSGSGGVTIVTTLSRRCGAPTDAELWMHAEHRTNPGNHLDCWDDAKQKIHCGGC